MPNGDETDVDCGGDSCDPCALGKACKYDRDCDSYSCRDAVCTIRPPDASTCETSVGGATCNDCLPNGDETDVDCGGDACGPCDLGKACKNDGDCMSLRCSNLICSSS